MFLHLGLKSQLTKRVGKMETHAAFMHLSYKHHLTTVQGHTENMLTLPQNIIHS